MAEPNDNLTAKLDDLATQYEHLEQQLADPAVLADPQRVRALNSKRSAWSDLIHWYRQYRAICQQIADNQHIIDAREDVDLTQLAQEELPELREEATQLWNRICDELVTSDDRAVGSVILEIRAGTGGAEAALWAGDLLEAYQRYAVRRGWSLSMMDFSPGDQGGIRNAIASVSGDGVWQGLGYEGGVHCVKRVPATEAQGRVHTSTATVAVLPEPQQVEMDIPDSEVKMDITTAQGPGGQNVNKVATAVHLIHIPTGIEVRMQESKSQHQNRIKAWQLLRARVFDHFQRQKDAQRAEARSNMIGTGGRSERVRTYRYKENIVVDHRLGRSLSLRSILEGDFDELVDALIAEDRARRLATM